MGDLPSRQQLLQIPSPSAAPSAKPFPSLHLPRLPSSAGQSFPPLRPGFHVGVAEPGTPPAPRPSEAMSLTNGTYYGPVDESPSAILLEKTFIASGYLTGVAYGIQLVFYAACVHRLWSRRPRIRYTLFLISYITVLCIMNTIWTGTSAYGVQLTYVDYRNYPGGPPGFLLVEFSLPSNVLSLASYIVGNILADALLLWRCRVIWIAAFEGSSRFVMIAPTLLLLTSVAVAIVFAIETASPSGFFAETTTSFGLPYFATSLSLNLLLTCLIAGRLWYYKREGRAVFGRGYGRHYTSILTIFIESAALYSLVSILLLSTYAVQHPINQIWLGLSPAVQMTATYLIIYRVAEGKAWNTEMFSRSGDGMSFPALAFEDDDPTDTDTTLPIHHHHHRRCCDTTTTLDPSSPSTLTGQSLSDFSTPRKIVDSSDPLALSVPIPLRDFTRFGTKDSMGELNTVHTLGYKTSHTDTNDTMTTATSDAYVYGEHHDDVGSSKSLSGIDLGLEITEVPLSSEKDACQPEAGETEKEGYVGMEDVDLNPYSGRGRGQGDNHEDRSNSNPWTVRKKKRF
ncbi:hypothetical protein K474DRAFT_724371 [Panus rudis PR-1116 ss-1]|nr:hypothetical protein K474DRAFT_724371 [Panus rudis PR-1116 ss-1]